MAIMTCHDLGTDSDRAGKPQLHLERTVNFTLTWNFGNMKRKNREEGRDEQGDDQGEGDMQNSFGGGGGED